MPLVKPECLHHGDTIATVSLASGCAGDSNMLRKYELGKKRLQDYYNLSVIAAPNSMRGSEYLAANPKARAEDLIWAFENKSVKAIIANIGGNDSIKLLQYIDSKTITDNPKIFIGYSDILNIHLLAYKAGLSTFYGHNLLTTIADGDAYHPYSDKWFGKVLFEPSAVIGEIEPFDMPCEIIQGSGIASGRLFGGHTGIMDIDPGKTDFDGAILFVEDIEEFFTPQCVKTFFRWLGGRGYLSVLNGVVIGKLNYRKDFSEHAEQIIAVTKQYGMDHLPIMYGLDFGHTNPQCIMPFGVSAEINCEMKTFRILEPGVSPHITSGVGYQTDYT